MNPTGPSNREITNDCDYMNISSILPAQTENDLQQVLQVKFSDCIDFFTEPVPGASIYHGVNL